VIAKFPKVDEKLADINTTIPPALAKEIENELAPEDERGPELSPKPDLFRGGGTALIQKDYENVSIGVYSSRGNADAIAIVITWRYHTCSQ
jgi:hypothetical protein